MKKDTNSSPSLIDMVSSYISTSARAELPSEIINKAKHHILDSLAAIVSGSKLVPGLVARKYVESQPGIEAQVLGSPSITSAVNAALANGMAAHADETDDTMPKGQHPGCAIVPASLAVAEKEGVDGMTFLKGVTTGYEFGYRLISALGWQKLTATGRDVHGYGGTFGAAAAAASILRLDEKQIRYVFSYAAEQASGMNYWPRDEGHIEKAFLFGGMPARNGVTAALLVQSGFTGIEDPFTGKDNFFEITAPDAKPELLTEGLGTDFSIMLASIKKYPIGNPIQAPMDALLTLMKNHKIKPGDVQSIVVYMPSVFRPVDNSNMPNVNLQYLLAATLIDGKLTFEAAHSHERMNDPSVIELKNRVKLVEDPGKFQKGISRQAAIVEITRKDNSKLIEQETNVRGSAENPLTSAEVEKKCSDLMTPVLGADRSQKLIDSIFNLEKINNVRDLRNLLSAPQKLF